MTAPEGLFKTGTASVVITAMIYYGQILEEKIRKRHIHQNTKHTHEKRLTIHTELVKSSWKTQQSANCCEPLRIAFVDWLVST